MNKDFYTYLHCKPDGTPFYVGKGSDGKRKRSHDFKNSRTKHHLRIIEKYGADNVRVFIFPCESEDQAFSDERQWIAQLRSEGIRLCNLTDGGDGITGLIFTPEHCAKLSIARANLSDETREKMAAAKRGRVLSLEHRTKIGTSNTGRVFSAETRAKISASSLGKKMSPEARAKMSAAKQALWAARRA